MTDKEYLEGLNYLWKAYWSICTQLQDPIFKNYWTAFGWNDNHGSHNQYSTQFYDLYGKYNSMLLKAEGESNAAKTVDDELIIWKKVESWGLCFLKWCEDHMMSEEFGAAFMEGKSGLVYNSEIWENVKQMDIIEKNLKITYSKNFDNVFLGMKTTNDLSLNKIDENKNDLLLNDHSTINQNEIKNKEEYVHYSDYKLLLIRIKQLEDSVKKLEDELEVLHSQLDYLINNTK